MGQKLINTQTGKEVKEGDIVRKDKVPYEILDTCKTSPKVAVKPLIKAHLVDKADCQFFEPEEFGLQLLTNGEVKIMEQMKDSEHKAWKALAGYKFWMFGYHAARWINYNNLLDKKQGSPLTALVKLARAKLVKDEVAK